MCRSGLNEILVQTSFYLLFQNILISLLQCYSLGVEDLAHLSAEEIYANDSYLVFFNGLILGKHTRPHVC